MEVFVIVDSKENSFLLWNPRLFVVLGLSVSLLAPRLALADREDDAEDLEYANIDIEMESRKTEDLKASEQFTEETLTHTYKDIKSAKKKIVHLGIKNDGIKKNIDQKMQELRQAQDDLRYTEGQVRASQKIVANHELKLKGVKDNLQASQNQRQAALMEIKKAQEEMAAINAVIKETREAIAQNDRDYANFKRQQKALAQLKVQRMAKLKALRQQEKVQVEAYNRTGFKVNTVAGE